LIISIILDLFDSSVKYSKNTAQCSVFFISLTDFSTIGFVFTGSTVIILVFPPQGRFLKLHTYILARRCMALYFSGKNLLFFY